MMAFIAHFLHFSKKEVYEMTFDEIIFWFNEAHSLWKKLNLEPEKHKP